MNGSLNLKHGFKKMKISGNKISPDGLDQEEAQGGDVDVRPGPWLSSFSQIFYCLKFVSSSLHVVLHLFFSSRLFTLRKGRQKLRLTSMRYDLQMIRLL